MRYIWWRCRGVGFSRKSFFEEQNIYIARHRTLTNEFSHITPFAMYCPPGSSCFWDLIPAHPRFTRMYGVTNSIAFQAIIKLRNLNQYSLLQNMINTQLTKLKSIFKTNHKRQMVAESVVIIFVASVCPCRTDTSKFRFFFRKER